MSVADDPGRHYVPSMPPDRHARIRAWHEAAYQRDRHESDVTVSYMGRTFVIPPQVHLVQGMADGLGEPLLREVAQVDRVLDMGTGCGVNAVLAASQSSDVLAVDINPVAVEAAKRNAALNCVADRVTVRESDVFGSVSGRFDLIVFDPPFRWFKPRDLRELGTADENYDALGRFMREVRAHLEPDGRILLCFGTSGDLGYLHQLINESGLSVETLTRRRLFKDDWAVDYFTYRLKP